MKSLITTVLKGRRVFWSESKRGWTEDISKAKICEITEIDQLNERIQNLKLRYPNLLIQLIDKEIL